MSELTPTGRVKKRKMKRSPARLAQDFKRKNGVLPQYRIGALREKVGRRDKRIQELTERLEKQKQSYDKKIHQDGIIHRREIRKLETKLRRQIKKYKDFQKRKGIKHRTVVHRTRYKHYEPSTKVKRYEETLLNLTNTHEKYLEMFERITKIMEVLSEYNEIHRTVLDINHFLVLLNTYYLRGNLKGIYSTSVNIPDSSAFRIRKQINYLADIGLVTRMSKSLFRINLLGEELLETIKNKVTRGKSTIVEGIKRSTGFIEEKDEIDYDEL